MPDWEKLTRLLKDCLKWLKDNMGNTNISSHTHHSQKGTQLCLCVFLVLVGKAGTRLWVATLNWLLDPSFLRQNTTRRKSCWRQIVPSESKANMYRPYFWVLSQNIKIYCSQGVGKKNQQSYQLFWNSNNNKKNVFKIHYYPMLPVESGLKTSMSKYSSSHRQKRKV